MLAFDSSCLFSTACACFGACFLQFVLVFLELNDETLAVADAEFVDAFLLQSRTSH